MSDTKLMLTVILAIFLFPTCSQNPESETESSRQSILATLKQEAEQGESAAQIQLGLIYLNGEDVPQDYAESVRWFRAAAEQGDQRAQVNLGYMYRDGLGIPQDLAKSVRWYRMAAEQGHASAQNALGVMYQSGYGVSQDIRESVKWYRMAAEQGHADAQIQLGLLNANGEGVSQSYVQAYKWFSLASGGSTGKEREGYIKARDVAAERMTPEEVVEAQRLADEWKPKKWEDIQQKLK